MDLPSLFYEVLAEYCEIAIRTASALIVNLRCAKFASSANDIGYNTWVLILDGCKILLHESVD